MDHDANVRKKFTNVKPQRVKADDFLAPTIEEDEMVEHLLAEPKTDNITVDSMLNIGKENVRKDSGVGEYDYQYDYFLNTYSKGGFDSNIAQGGQDELELGVLDGLLDEVEEVEDLHAADGLASPSEDFLLEIGFVSQASLWNYPPRESSHSRNKSPEIHSPGISGSSNSAVGISESSSVTVQELECKNDSSKTTDKKSQDTFKHKKRRKNAVQSKINPASHDLQDPKKLVDNDDDDDDPLLSSMLIKKNVKEFGDTNRVGDSRREKRMRRPTQRYIEELSDKKSKHKKREGKFSHNPQVVCGSKVQAGSETKASRGRPKKQISISPLKESEDDFSSESEDERELKKRSDKNDRRKHQRMWTITEVSRLVDGISEFGVGRWTEIKRLLFATTVYRTPIDLRDKWRNLLRASSLHKLKKKEVEEKQSHPLRPLPKSLIRRVSELAKVHPYPRVRGQKSIARSARKSERK